MKIFICYIFSFLIISCHSGEKNKKTIVNKGVFMPVIIDSLPISKVGLNVKTMQTAHNKIIYNRPLIDTIHVKKYPNFSYENYLKLLKQIRNTNSIDSLNILVSTNQTLSIEYDEINFESSTSLYSDKINENNNLVQSDRFNRTSKQLFQSLPILIYNPSHDTIIFQLYNGKIKMKQEAKDEDGNWKPIEYWQNIICGTGQAKAIILPLQVLVLKIYRYNGPFKTEMRIKLEKDGRIFYSNTFFGTINTSQFEVPKYFQEN